MKKFRPMLAADAFERDLSEIEYPVLGTPKIDGIRCLIRGAGGQKILTRSLKKVPNKYIRKHLRKQNLAPYDGELAVGTNWSDCTSGIMSHDGKPDFTYYVFGLTYTGLTYEQVVKLLKQHAAAKYKRVKFLIPVLLKNEKQLRAYLKKCLREGYEGICWRSPKGMYKFGRSTWKQGWLSKLKPFADDEGEIVDLVEEMHNGNEKTKDNLGLSKRSSKSSGFKGKGTLGAFIVKSKKWKKLFRVGTGVGLTKDKRQVIWDLGIKKMKGRIIKYKYQTIGSKDRPRIPVFLGFRDKRDMS